MYDSPCLAANANAQWSQPQVIVDDSDPRIVYTGNWISDLGEGSSYWGNSFNDTTHRSKLDSNSSSFSFSFQGTAFTVLGGVDVQQSPGGTGDTTSTQESRTCLVDGQQLSNITSGTNILCGVEGLNEAEHKVTFTAHAASPSGLVAYVDAVQYTPLSGQGSSADRAIMMVDACDQSINFGGGAKHWTAFDPPQSSGVGSGAPLGYRGRYKGVNTNFSGNQLSYEFTGTKLQWMSTVLSPQDGGSPSQTQTQTQAAWANFEVHTSDSRVLNDTIQLQQLAQANLTQYNQLVYETPDLPAGTHKLIATYQGDSDTVPLSLSYFYVHTTTTTTTTTTPSSHDSGRRIGAIVGGVVGGVVGLLAVLGLLWVVYHKRQRKMEMRAWDVVWKNRTQRGQVWQESLEMGPPKSERG